MHDVIVGGAGPAGSACALRLARAGVDVTIIDKASFPRTKVCGEYLNTAAIAELDRLGLFDAVVPSGAALAGIRLRTAQGICAELPFASRALSLRRSVLDQCLLEAAMKAGARFIRAKIHGVYRQNGSVNGVVLRDDAGTHQTLPSRIVVAADGMGSPLAKAAGLTAGRAAQARFALGGHYAGFASLDDHIEMYVGNGEYFAINPLRDACANVMIVVSKARLSRWSGAVDVRMNNLARELGHGVRSFADVMPVDKRRSIGPLSHRTQRCVGRGIYLVGDAAGFLDPFSGQGVALALASASQAADAIGATLQQPARWRTFAAQYELARKKDFGARGAIARLISLVLGVPFLTRRMARKLSANPELTVQFMRIIGGADGLERAFEPAHLLGLLA